MSSSSTQCHREYSFRSTLTGLTKLAAPIIGAQILQCFNGFIDTVMAGHHSAMTLSQVAMGASFWIPFLIAVSSLYSGIGSLIAHAFGTGDLPRLRALFGSASAIAVFMSIACMALLFQAFHVFPLFKVPEELGLGIQAYLDMVAWGFPGVLMFWVLRCWVEGLHNTKLALIASLVAVLLNVPLNYFLIYGWWIIPEMGAKGCGIATAISMWLMPLIMIFLMHRAGIFARYHIRLTRPFAGATVMTIRESVRIGWPLGLTGFVEASFFCVIAIMLAPLGMNSVAAHQITLNAASLVFMVPLGLSYAQTVAVGEAMGAGRIGQVRHLIFAGQGLAFCFAVLSCGTLFMLRDWIPRLYTSDEHVIQIASHLLIYAAIFQLPDCSQVVLMGALKGMQDTFVPMILSIMAYWLFGALLGYMFTYSNAFGSYGAAGAWMGLNIGLMVATVVFCVRVLIIFKRRVGNSLIQLSQ